MKAQHTTSKGKASNDEAAKRRLLKHGGALVIFVAWVKFFGVNGAEAPDRAGWKILAILGSIYFWYFLIYPFINGLCSDQRKSVGDEPQTVQPNASPKPPPRASSSESHD